jgi:hypothetical protein
MQDIHTLRMMLEMLRKQGRAPLARGDDGDKWARIVGHVLSVMNYSYTVSGTEVGREIVLRGHTCECCGQVVK